MKKLFLETAPGGMFPESLSESLSESIQFSWFPNLSLGIQLSGLENRIQLKASQRNAKAVYGQNVLKVNLLLPGSLT